MADYTLTAKINGDASGFTKAFQGANETLSALSEKTKAVGEKVSSFGKSLSEVGSGITAKFTAPIVGAVGYAVKSFADLEQAVGGVETLFKDSASTVIANSETAFRRAGVSGVSYMEQVTSFSASLLQGLGGDTVAAAKYADMAIVDMSDNANKMGTDIGMIQNAYQGFAKDNFTMLDNLKLGYGGTQGEMARLVNDSGVLGKSFKATAENVKDIPFDQLIQAIHITQEELDITGTTALEAEKTVSGSFQSMISAGQNLAGGLGSPTANIQSLLSDLQSTVMTFAENVKRVLGTIWDNLPMAEWQKWAAVIAVSIGPVLMVLGVLISGIGTLITTLGFIVSPIGLVITAILALAGIFGYFMATNESFRNSVMSVFQTVSGYIQGFISKVAGMGPQIMSVLGSVGSQIGAVFQTVWGIVQTIVPIFTTFFSSLIGGFQEAGGVGSGFGIQLVSIFMGLNPIIKMVIMLFQNFGPQITAAFQQIVAMVLPVVATLGTALGQLASAVIPLIMQAVSTLIPVIIQMGMTMMNIISAVLPILISLFNQLFPIIMQVVLIVIDLVAQFMPLVAVIISSLLPVIQNLILAFMNIVQAVAPAFIAIIQLIIGVIQALLPIIMSIITVVVHVFAGIVSTISPIVAFIAAIISAIMAVISPIIVFVAGVITSIIAVIRPIIVTVTGIFNTVFSVISGVWRNIMTFIGSAINKISSIINGISSTVSGVFSSVFSTISRIMDKVSSKVSGVFSAIQGAWSGLTAFVSGVFSGISGSVQTLVNQVKGFVNGVIGGINAAVSLINKIPGVSISKIPQLARGTDDWQGGFARMNEGGRGELVNLPNGSQVIPHDVSMRYAREAGRNTSDQSGGRYQQVDNDMSRVEAWLEKIANSNQVVVLDSGAIVGETFNEYDRVGGTKTVLTERWEY